MTVTGVLFYFLGLPILSLKQIVSCLNPNFNVNASVDRLEQKLTYALFHIQSQGEATVSALPRNTERGFGKDSFLWSQRCSKVGVKMATSEML